MPVSLVGHLLVATPLLRESAFDRAVILMLSHDDDGALGVVVNRPTDVPVDSMLPEWTHVASDPAVIFDGGPVSPESALALVFVDAESEPLGVRRITPQVGLVDLDTPVEVVEQGVSGLRVFSGYAGWSPDQLESEIDEGSWYVLDAQPGDAFRADATELWRTVLHREGGDLALVSTFPEDPSLN
ncbi:YqgE/AlgH family protein [Actinobacteria bacterium YIM 96077]|uniref:UPF0301 protein DPM12_00690 n=1 Tax=Phytoactinopolyspora halophila TaxID=1981511 RepID=A0A329R1Y0_9ACTN|nr:YqgE/AlgH family protein [Phytoactinopolyspora halophila]AYY12130.1 YqgE/AlgH family protein [Actinobacteria bacterium YIM 96077]RAW18635.1 YqgE/AlgH family protein [Phytoactinopolyspora halophila]